jgi:N-acetylglucosaminyldiphosphoundecaprenol N-acetyl-beta-D-mannosaminyltransferase
VNDAAAVPALRRVQIGVARIAAVTESQCVNHVVAELEAGRGGWLLTANVEHLRLMQTLPQYRCLTATAALTVADGMPLVWASRLQGDPLPERVTGSNLIHSLSRAAAGAGRAIFLLGGNPGTAEAAAAVLCRRYSALRVAGTLSPPPGFDDDRDELQRVVSAVAAAGPDIVYVALSTPRQDQLCAELRRALPRAWCMGVGISFSFLSGDVSRAPHWIQSAGLEWLHRLTQEPRRMAPRYLRNFPVALKLLGATAARRLLRSGE